MAVLESDLSSERSRSLQLNADLEERVSKVADLESELSLRDAVISEQGSLMQRNLLDYAAQVRHNTCI